MKNKHNETVGSEIERSNERIEQTGEVFTSIELCAEMVSEIPESILQNDKNTFLDNSAGSLLSIGIADRIIEISFIITYQ